MTFPPGVLESVRLCQLLEINIPISILHNRHSNLHLGSLEKYLRDPSNISFYRMHGQMAIFHNFNEHPRCASVLCCIKRYLLVWIVGPLAFDSCAIFFAKQCGIAVRFVLVAICHHIVTILVPFVVMPMNVTILSIFKHQIGDIHWICTNHHMCWMDLADYIYHKSDFLRDCARMITTIWDDAETKDRL
jgi:hypothetical protein